MPERDEVQAAVRAEQGRGMTKKRGCFAIGCASVIFLGLIGYIAEREEGKSTSSTPEQSSADETCSSSNCVLRAPTEGRDVVLAVSKEALDEMFSAGSDRAIAVMVLNGSAFLAPQGTRVSVVDRAFLRRMVLVLDGPTMGRTGWVPKEWVVDR